MKKPFLLILILLVIITPLTIVFAQNQELKKALINTINCTGCGDCVTVCPTKAISLVNQKAVIDADKCINCLICVKACNYKAISGSRELK